LNSFGDVGIGNTNPQANLHVTGSGPDTLAIIGDMGDSELNLRGQFANSISTLRLSNAGTGGWTFSNTSSISPDMLVLAPLSGGNDTLAITQAGDVAIGSNNLSEGRRLKVFTAAADAKATDGVYVENQGGEAVLDLVPGLAGASDWQIMARNDVVGLSIWNATTERLRIDSVGDIWSYADSSGANLLNSWYVNTASGFIRPNNTSYYLRIPNSSRIQFADDGRMMSNAGKLIIRASNYSSNALQIQGPGSSNIMNFDTNNNYVGIGTTAPNQALEVNGGIRLNTVTAKPTCDATTRGTTWFTQGAAGVKDDFEVCAKDAGDAYAWRTIY
jgi:hypothetical protein